MQFSDEFLIYLAEDDEDDVEIFRDLMLEMPVPVVVQVAANGQDLLARLQTATRLPRLIFLDMNMPIKNGMQCLQEIKAHPLWRGITVVVLSTSSNPEQMAMAYRCGADEYMVKMNSYAEFKQALSDFFAARTA